MARLSCPRLRLFALASLLPLFLSCSALEADCARDGHASYDVRGSFDARARVRRVDCGFHSSVQDVVALPDGSAWLRRGQYRNLEDDAFYLPPDKFLTRVGAGGELLTDLQVPEFLQHIAAHPSGEVTVLGWEKQPLATQQQFVRLAADGSQIATRVFTNDTYPEERLTYEYFPDGRLERVEEPRDGRYLNILAAAAHGEDVYVLAAWDGLRLLRLDNRLNIVWDHVVSASVALRDFDAAGLRDLGVPLAGWFLSVDEEGGVTVVQPFLAFQRLAYTRELGRTVEGPGGRAMLLSRFGANGALLSARTVPVPSQVDEVVGLGVRDGVYALGARANTVVAREGKPTESDLHFVSGRWDRPAGELVQRTFSLDQDDVPSAFIPCGAGRFCFAGHTGFTELPGQMDTAGQGFILALNAQGEPRDELRLQGERDTQVVRASEGPGGSVVFAFITNQAADIGRVGDKFKNNETWVGVFGGP